MATNKLRIKTSNGFNEIIRDEIKKYELETRLKVHDVVVIYYDHSIAIEIVSSDTYDKDYKDLIRVWDVKHE